MTIFIATFSPRLWTEIRILLGSGCASSSTPRGDELRRRVKSVLVIIYLIFDERYTATSGGDWMRAALCEEALPLRTLVELLPGESASRTAT